MNRLQWLSLSVLAAVAFTAYGQDADCSESHVAEMACQRKRLDELNGELNRVYALALAAMPEKNEQDSRKSREQLRQSQRAWITFLHANCALEGGLQGGSNSWISNFAGNCEESELTSRIKFLRSIAAAGGGQ